MWAQVDLLEKIRVKNWLWDCVLHMVSADAAKQRAWAVLFQSDEGSALRILSQRHMGLALLNSCSVASKCKDIRILSSWKCVSQTCQGSLFVRGWEQIFGWNKCEQANILGILTFKVPSGNNPNNDWGNESHWKKITGIYSHVNNRIEQNKCLDNSYLQPYGWLGIWKRQSNRRKKTSVLKSDTWLSLLADVHLCTGFLTAWLKVDKWCSSSYHSQVWLPPEPGG